MKIYKPRLLLDSNVIADGLFRQFGLRREFYPIVNFTSPDLKRRLADWQVYYNHFRLHALRDWKTPQENLDELFMKAPYHEKVKAAFEESKERLRLQNYRDDLD